MNLLDIFKNNSDTIDGLMALYGLYDGLTSSNEAEGNLDGYTADQIERQNQINALFTEGGDLMRTNIERLLTEYGNFGQVTPDIVDSITEYLAGERSAEEQANIATVNSMTREDENRFVSFEDAFRGLATDTMDSLGAEVRDADAYARMVAPDTLDYAQMQDSITQKFLAMRQGATQKYLNEARAKASANMDPGLMNSTLAVQTEKALGALAADRYAQDVLDSVSDANSYLTGLQQLASNDQNMTNAERNMQRNLLADKYGLSGSALDQMLTGSSHGQNTADNMNSLRYNAINELGQQQGLRNNTAMTDMLNGYSIVGSENTLANNYLTQVTNTSTAPYTYAAGGMNSINNVGSTMDSLNAAANSANSIAAGNMAGFGDWVRSITL